VALRVLEAGLLCSVQDAGRPGYERFGVPVSGAMDWYALRAANLLTGNLPGAAAIEFLAFAPPVFEAESDVLLAGCGAGFTIEVDGVPIPRWMAFRARPGQNVRLSPDGAGCWGVLAAAGGINTPPVLGSRSTYLRARLGGLEGRALIAGDRLPLVQAGRDWQRRAGSRLRPDAIPAYAQEVTLEIIPSARLDAFAPGALETLLSEAYTVSPTSDRMGYRLEGARLAHARGADILSEGAPLGALQVPGSGQPLLLMSDRQPTGGYTKIATLTSASLPLAAQCRPGEGRMRFRAVTVNQAQASLRGMAARLERAIETDEDEWGLRWI